MQIDGANVRAMGVGCSILGAGGGGDTAIGVMAALQAIEELGPVPVVDLDDLDDDALVMPCGGIGAPMIWIEKIDRGDEITRLIPVVERIHGSRVAALMSAEIGGSNGLRPSRGQPVRDCRWSTPTAWVERSPRSRRSPCRSPASPRARR